jgi:positive regulator of sigma E activity
MTLVMLFVLALHLFTWGTDFKMAKDEMGKQITHHSATISYHISALGLFVFWIVDGWCSCEKGISATSLCLQPYVSYWFYTLWSNFLWRGDTDNPHLLNNQSRFQPKAGFVALAV